MTSSRAKLFIFINLLSVIKVSLLETVHFTNSPKKILKANNYTTYKVEVPNGGDPITIIEANVPLINKNIKFNDVENAKYPIMHNRDSTRKNQVIDLETSLSMTVTPNKNNYNEEYENLSTGEESVTNFSPERYRDQNSMKTVYSPELLQKFLKDYANKVHAATASTESAHSHIMSNESEMGTDKEKDKYESIETDEQEEGNRRVSSASTDDNEASELNDIQQRKNYRPNGSYNHPYNKNNGWVTLDAVPWSKSKVSRWQSNSNKHGNYNYNSNNNNHNSQRPPNRPLNHYDYDYNSANINDNDDYYAPKPSRPTYHNNQFYGGSHQFQSSSRPTQDSWQQQSIQTYHVSNHGQHGSSSHYGPSSSSHYDDHRPNKPYQPDIITDNRPSNFPQHGEEQRPYGNRPSSHDNGHGYHGGNYYHSYKEQHPASYPTNGEGEWILVSTTKGYQYPKRNGQRAMSFKAQNGFKEELKYAESNGIITAAGSQKVETFIRPNRSPSPTKMSQQQVKLTVLPLFVNEHQAPNVNKHEEVNLNVFKPSSYEGLIETENSNQTVEESAASIANEANAIASSHPVTKKKRKVMKNYLMRKNSGSDSSAVIAAVGASLLPASLGLLAPLVLGK